MRVATELNKKITSEPSPNAVSSTMDDEEGADGALQVVGPYNKPAKNSQMIILFSKIQAKFSTSLNTVKSTLDEKHENCLNPK